MTTIGGKRVRDAVSVTVPRPIYNRIRARLKPYQAMAGALEELLDIADKYQPLPKAPTTISSPPEFLHKTFAQNLQDTEKDKRNK